MTELQPGFADDDACLSVRFELVTLRLAVEVNRLRALRGEGRDERFAGVLMRDCDVAALCAELITAPMPTSEDLAQAWDHAQARYAARLAATPVLPVYERVRELYALSPLEEEILACCLAVAVDPRLGRVLGYLREDMAQTGLSVGLAQRMFGVPLTQIWSALGADGVLIRHGILRVDDPLTDRAVIDVPPDILRVILAGPTEAEAACQMPLAGHPPEGPILIEAVSDLDGLIALGEPGPTRLRSGICSVAAQPNSTSRRCCVTYDQSRCRV